MKEKKDAHRALARERESAAKEREIRAADELVRRTLLMLPEYRRAGTVFCFVGTGPEPDTMPILEEALAAGKTVAVPKITGRGIMEARQIFSTDELRPGAFGLPEPGEESPVVSPEELELIITPSAAFGRDLTRLGKGGGYYDRYMALSGALRVGLGREKFLFDTLPMDKHDLKVDILITETCVRRAGKS